MSELKSLLLFHFNCQNVIIFTSVIVMPTALAICVPSLRVCVSKVIDVHLSDRAVCRALINKFLCLFVVYQVEYDLLNSSTDDLRLISSERIEQSALPQCFAWYPPIVKENFLVVANDQVVLKE